MVADVVDAVASTARNIGRGKRRGSTSKKHGDLLPKLETPACEADAAAGGEAATTKETKET